MRPEEIREILESIKKGEMETDEAVERLRRLPFSDLGFAKVDGHRELRQGYPEVIFGEGKSAEKIAAIMQEMIKGQQNVLVTRLDESKAAYLMETFDAAEYFKEARILRILHGSEKKGRGKIYIVAAGTSDIPVADEAYITAESMGNDVERLYDVGVAGLHRLLFYHEKLLAASVVIAVAGMEGALPSVVGGLVSCPVIAVPTSIGYGASFKGIAALLAMLNSCASGVTVVNIDNGYGAAYAASLINRVHA